jgi:hypothetical protein
MISTQHCRQSAVKETTWVSLKFPSRSAIQIKFPNLYTELPLYYCGWGDGWVGGFGRFWGGVTERNLRGHRDLLRHFTSCSGDNLFCRAGSQTSNLLSTVAASSGRKHSRLTAKCYVWEEMSAILSFNVAQQFCEHRATWYHLYGSEITDVYRPYSD